LGEIARGGRIFVGNGVREEKDREDQVSKTKRLNKPKQTKRKKKDPNRMPTKEHGSNGVEKY